MAVGILGAKGIYIDMSFEKDVPRTPKYSHDWINEAKDSMEASCSLPTSKPQREGNEGNSCPSYSKPATKGTDKCSIPWRDLGRWSIASFFSRGG